MIYSEGDFFGSSEVVGGKISKKLLFFVVKVLFLKNFCCFLRGNAFSDLLKFLQVGFSEIFLCFTESCLSFLIVWVLPVVGTSWRQVSVCIEGVALGKRVVWAGGPKSSNIVFLPGWGGSL